MICPHSLHGTRYALKLFDDLSTQELICTTSLYVQ
uniref:Uncharacterized protein n=1 Tax=Arundo donax TaxID=35708 RepID=A0A0A9CC64_ARUDO